jgi:hypothetical protein
MKDKVIYLPSKEEMLRRLVSVNPETHFQDHFYPLLLKHAETKIVAVGVVTMLTLAIIDYTEGMLPVFANIMYSHVPSFIEALIDDVEVKEEAKKFFMDSLEAIRKQKKQP